VRAAHLIERHPEAWHAATHHPFLDAVRDGALPADAFAAWLTQDYLFVGDLLAAQARLLARAPRPDHRVLAGGLVAVEAELGWFEGQAGRWSIALAAPRHPTTVAYNAALEGLDREPYGAALVALWALERAYLEAWRGAAPGQVAYREFVDHWTTPAFAAYVVGLEAAADRALVAGDTEGVVERAFREVVRLEQAFWAMSWAESDR